jgi:predicted XRE-type DNA-binding protein
MTTAGSSTLALQGRPADRAAARVQAYAELQEMSKAMVREKGLLNYAQAALLLDVSTKRVSELVRTGKLQRFDFLGRTYVSMREVGERYQQDLKAGRPRQNVGKRAAASVKAALKTDRVQAKLGGYAGPYVRAREQANKERTREDLKKVWRAITGKRKQ